MDRLQQLWAASGTTAIRRDPAQPGARARVHADIRRTNPRCPCTVASLDAAAGGAKPRYSGVGCSRAALRAVPEAEIPALVRVALAGAGRWIR